MTALTSYSFISVKTYNEGNISYNMKFINEDGSLKKRGYVKQWEGSSQVEFFSKLPEGEKVGVVKKEEFKEAQYQGLSEAEF